MKPFLLVIALALAGCEKTDIQQKFEAAQSAVRQSLRAPSTAKFCPINEVTFSKKDGADLLELWVDSQNFFGAQLRSHWGVTLEPGSYLVKSTVCYEDEMAKNKFEHERQMEEIAASTREALRTINRQ